MRKRTKTVQGSASHRSAHLLINTLHKRQCRRRLGLTVSSATSMAVVPDHSHACMMPASGVALLQSAQLLHCCDSLPLLLQGSVVLDPYAIAVVGRRQYGALGPVSLHASPYFREHALCSAGSTLVGTLLTGLGSRTVHEKTNGLWLRLPAGLLHHFRQYGSRSCHVSE